jgi:spore coat protein U-like protein
MLTLRRSLLSLLSALTVTALAVPAGAQKQSTGAIGVSATIPYPLLTGTGIRPLNFGVIVPSAGPVTVLPNYVSGSLSGEWRLTGTANQKSLDISFTLPTQLTASGGRILAISFDGPYAGLCEIDTTQTCQATSWMTWNPRPSGVAVTFHDTPQRWKPGRPKYEYNFYSVYIGGQVQPTATQPGGVYSGTVGVVIVIN